MSQLGKKFIDECDWKACNQKIVDRGAFLLNQSILKKWKKGVDRLNDGRYGRQYEFSDELIYWAAMQHIVLGMPYRQIEGFLKTYFKGTGVRVPDYTTLYKRIKALRFDVEVSLKRIGVCNLFC